jgi:hypothetical protein
MVCEYCGALLRTPVDVREEKEALERLHGLLMEANKKKQAQLLMSGFLPESESTIISAGLRCIPFAHLGIMEDTDIRFGALMRLKMIVTRLKLMPPSDPAHRAIVEFEPAIRTGERIHRLDTRLVTVAAVALVIVLPLVIVIGVLY